MHPDLLNILQSQDQPIDNEQLIAYLTGQLSAAESRAIEEKLAAGGMDAEAIEGLMLVADKQKLPAYQHELQQFIRQRTQHDRRRLRPLQMGWGWLAVATGLLIALAILVWYVVHFMQHKG
jgi:anti-sigma factor RsiW